MSFQIDIGRRRMLCIRPAAAADAEMLARLFDQADGGLSRPRWAAAASPGQTPFAVGAAEIVSNRTRQALRDAWVAEDDGMVVGAILAYRMTPAIIGTDEPYAQLKMRVLGSWYIDSLAVLEGRRSSGVGRSLLHAADDAACHAGCNDLSLLVYDNNPAAAALYARCGFVQTHAHPLPSDHPTGARNIRLLQREASNSEH
ncbi:GNAT family N-acetyltransferase [Pseudooceanicola nanhaiensis]|uniref:GNAT family N-acetyltransferase n=1 Tax=Pseudooceanicola nanhaiensis TaxID=375761 RepID=UPI004059FC2F